MMNLMTLPHLTLSDLERSSCRSLRFQSIQSRKGAELGYMFLLNTNRKSHMGSPKGPSYLTLSDHERSKPRPLRFRSVICCERAELGHMLLLKINRKAYMGSPLTPHI